MLLSHAHAPSFIRLLPAIILALTSVAAVAAEGGPHRFNPQSGEITVGDHLAVIKLPEGMVFLPTEDARYVLEKQWHNPPDPSVLGMVVKESEGKSDDETAVVVSYADDGHVDDGDARSINYADLLKEMQEAISDNNEERVKAGYPSAELLGWAEPPHYDSQARKLYWAKSMRFGGEREPTLNYCIRILGRKGVLELNALGRTADLAKVSPVARQVMQVTEFTTGNRYQDYQEGVDLKQAGGIAGLIVGGLVAKKLGFFALIGLGLLKFAKILILPLILFGGWIATRYRGWQEARAERAQENERRAQAEREEIQRMRVSGRMRS